MKVLLCQDVKRLGWLGDVVEVSTGYARNYLLPQRLAMVATESNLKSLAKAKASGSEQRMQEKERLERAAAAVDGAEVVIAAKANEQGHLFGSVGSGDIAANLREQGLLLNEDCKFQIGNCKLQIADSESPTGVLRTTTGIKQVGTHSVTLKFDDGLTATVSVVVVPEQEAERRISD